MLEIHVPISQEEWDDEKQMFIPPKTVKLQLEHSLISISKWESKWHKPFFLKEDKSPEETIDYIRCMTLTQNVKPEIYELLTEENINEIQEYIGNPMTATTFSNRNDNKQSSSRELVTSELVYYWMVSLNIPFDECQKWHINRLLTLIRVCNVKNEPPKKMSQKELYKHHAAVNAARRKKKP